MRGGRVKREIDHSFSGDIEDAGCGCYENLVNTIDTLLLPDEGYAFSIDRIVVIRSKICGVLGPD